MGIVFADKESMKLVTGVFDRLDAENQLSNNLYCSVCIRVVCECVLVFNKCTS